MRAFVVEVPGAEAEMAADVLFAIGAPAVEERLGSAGTIELWTHLGDGDDCGAAAARALAAAAARAEVPAWSCRQVDLDRTVAESWRAHATPTWITDDLVVVPAWTAAGDLTVAAQHGGCGSAVRVVPIDPGAAFGMGDHPTTVLTLRSLLATLAQWPGATPPVVLDVGCGSGVLGIVAALSGAARVVAIDIHGAAIEATGANAARNGVSERVEVSGRPLAEVDGVYDVVLANLLAPALVDLAPDLVRTTSPGGVLVVSGLLDGRYDHVVAALDPMVVRAVRTLGGWAAVELRAPG